MGRGKISGMQDTINTAPRWASRSPLEDVDVSSSSKYITPLGMGAWREKPELAGGATRVRHSLLHLPGCPAEAWLSPRAPLLGTSGVGSVSRWVKRITGKTARQVTVLGAKRRTGLRSATSCRAVTEHSLTHGTLLREESSAVSDALVA